MQTTQTLFKAPVTLKRWLALFDRYHRQHVYIRTINLNPSISEIIWTPIRQKHYCVAETACESGACLLSVSAAARTHIWIFWMGNHCHLNIGSHGCLNPDLLTINRAALQQPHFGGLKTNFLKWVSKCMFLKMIYSINCHRQLLAWHEKNTTF